MARRRTSRKKTSRRRRKSGLNLVNAAELYLTTNVLTKSMFGANPFQFITGRTSGFGSTTVNGQETMTYYNNQYRPGYDGSIITLPELLGVDAPNYQVAFGGDVMGQGALKSQIESNLANFGGIGNVVTQTILLKVGFTVGKKLLRKQRTVLNKGINLMGLKGSVSV